jgi:hypothetical protein
VQVRFVRCSLKNAALAAVNAKSAHPIQNAVSTTTGHHGSCGSWTVIAVASATAG